MGGEALEVGEVGGGVVGGLRGGVDGSGEVGH